MRVGCREPSRSPWWRRLGPTGVHPRLRAPLAGSDYGNALTPNHWPSHSAANAIEIWSLHNFHHGTFHA